MWRAKIEKLRTPNQALARPLNDFRKPRWHTIYQNTKGERYIMLRGRRVYEHHWVYPEKQNAKG